MNDKKSKIIPYSLFSIWILFMFVMICPVTIQAAEKFDNLLNAAAYVRTNMLNHINPITFEYKAEGLQDQNIDSYIRNQLKSEINKYDPSIPVAGDYLERNTDFIVTHEGNPSQDSVLKVTCIIDYKMTKEQDDYVSTEISRILLDLSISGKSDLDKIKIIYNYICSNIDYDHSGSDLAHTAYAALHDHACNCQGYSTLLYRMLLTSGIECRIITGKYEGVAHSWNIVKYNGSWYSLDACLDRDEKTNGNHSCFMVPGSAWNNDAFSGHVRDAKYTGTFYNSYPMKIKDTQKTVTKLTPDVTIHVSKSTNTVKYKKLKKKSQSVSPIKAVSPVPLEYSILSSKYSKYFSISRTSGRITIKKISKKNKPKKKTYSLTIRISSSETDNYTALPSVYKKIKIKIK